MIVSCNKVMNLLSGYVSYLWLVHFSAVCFVPEHPLSLHKDTEFMVYKQVTLVFIWSLHHLTS